MNKRISAPMEFPYGKAPFVILILSIVSGALILLTASQTKQDKPDLIFATFAKEHYDVYTKLIPEFERQNQVKVQLELVDQRSLQNRLQAAMQVNASVPDMVELLDGSMGIFTSGPISEVGFIDLNERIRSSGLDKELVSSRFSKWSSRGHLFAIPHDVHPVMLAYRRDLVEQFGIDVKELKTWDDFARVGREIVAKSKNPSGVVQHYMIDMQADGGSHLRLLILQHGGDFFDDQGKVIFDNEHTLDVICWYVHQIDGEQRISFPCGWGQGLTQAMTEGLCLFYFCPDWRTKQFQEDAPHLNGKMGLMPLPVWNTGGTRTSTWGGTGLAITKQCKKPDLAWKLANYLYFDRTQLGERFTQSQILSPLKSAWNLPELKMPNPYYSGVSLGQSYSELADAVPPEQVTAYTGLAETQLSQGFIGITSYYKAHGDVGLREFAREELTRRANRVREIMGRNKFIDNSSLKQEIAQ